MPEKSITLIGRRWHLDFQWQEFYIPRGPEQGQALHWCTAPSVWSSPFSVSWSRPSFSWCTAGSDWLWPHRPPYVFILLFLLPCRCFNFEAIPLVDFCSCCLCFQYHFPKEIDMWSAKTKGNSLHCFPTGSVTVPGLMFKFLIYFEIIFVDNVTCIPISLFCMSLSSFLNTICWDCFFPFNHSCLPCQMLVDNIYVEVYFWAAYSDLFMCPFYVITIWFLLVRLCSIVLNQELWCLQLCPILGLL